MDPAFLADPAPAGTRAPSETSRYAFGGPQLILVDVALMLVSAQHRRPGACCHCLIFVTQDPSGAVRIVHTEISLSLVRNVSLR